MIIAIVSTILVLGQTSPRTIDAGERASLAMILLTPGGSSLGSASERWLRLADASLRRHSRLAVKSPEQLGIDGSRLFDCELDRRLSCWVRETKTTAADAPTYLLALSVLQTEERDAELTALLIDLDESGTILEKTKDQGAAENALFERVRTVRASKVDVEDDTVLAALFDRWFSTDLAVNFRTKNLSALPGSLSLQLDVEYLTLVLDGKTLGATGEDRKFLISELAPGTRAMVLRDSKNNLQVHAQDVEVRSNMVTPLSLSLKEPDRWMRSYGVGGGALVFVLGALFTTVSVATRDERVTPCLSGVDCEAESKILPGAAAGLGIGVFGATWAVGSALGPELGFDDDTSFWWSLLAGVALGASTTGLSFALGR